MEQSDREWEGSPLELAANGIDPNGIKEIVIQFDNGDEEVLKPRLRDEFRSYELAQAAHYIKALSAHIRARRVG